MQADFKEDTTVRRVETFNVPSDTEESKINN
jgi:hypothetical protein